MTSSVKRRLLCHRVVSRDTRHGIECQARLLNVIIEGDCCHRKVPEEGQGRVSCLPARRVARRPAAAARGATSHACNETQLRPPGTCKAESTSATEELLCSTRGQQARVNHAVRTTSDSGSGIASRERPVGTVGMRTAAGCGRRRPRSPYRSKGRTQPWPSPS